MKPLQLAGFLGTLVILVSSAGATTSALPGNNARSAESGHVMWASGIGAALNTNLMLGQGTDDTGILQRALDRAAGGRAVHLIIDGPALVSGLEVYANTTIECTAGGGLYLRDGANRAIVRNKHRSREGVIDRNIAVRGCFLNGNRDRQRIGAPLNNGRYTPRESDGTYQSGIQFLGVDYLTLENITLWNIRSYAIWVANAKVVHLSNIVVDTGLPPFPDGASLSDQQKYMSSAVSDDGVHFNGPIQYLSVDGLKLRTVDDALALNANDETADDITAANQMGPYVGQGPITDVVIRNVLFMDAHQGIRLLSRNQRIDRILMENLAGTVRQRVVNISHFFNTSHQGNFGSVIFSNVAVDPVKSPSYLDVYPHIKDNLTRYSSFWDVAEEADRALFTINSPVESLRLHHVVTKAIDGRPVIRIGRDAVIQALNIDVSIQDPIAQAVPMKLLGRVERLRFSLDWIGKKQPISYEGGSIGSVEQKGESDGS